MMRIVGTVALGIGVVAVSGISATVGWRPFIGPSARALTDRHFEATEARLARGKYLVTGGVPPCMACHSELAPDAHGRLDVVPGMALAGRTFAPEGAAFVTAPNLTPDPETGTGTWTDDQLARAIREGIGHDGRALFPIMPYRQFRHMTDEDLASIVVYLRSLPPVKHVLPRSEVPFPINRLINTLPEPITAPVTADLSTPEKRGKYLVTIGACNDCHTPRDDKGNVKAGLDFGGGTRMTFAGIKDVYSANITQGVNGIPYYNQELFVETLRTGRVRERELSSMMPTVLFRNLTDEDLKAIFAYLKTLPPVDHYVDNTLPPTACPRCGLTHGGGERNKKIG
jgi:mono/diheme cytochrome c family protein